MDGHPGGGHRLGGRLDEGAGPGCAESESAPWRPGEESGDSRIAHESLTSRPEARAGRIHPDRPSVDADALPVIAPGDAGPRSGSRRVAGPAVPDTRGLRALLRGPTARPVRRPDGTHPTGWPARVPQQARPDRRAVRAVDGRGPAEAVAGGPLLRVPGAPCAALP